MSSFEEAITHYIARYRIGHAEDALHGLLELGRAVLPDLEGAYRSCRDPGLRTFLLEVIWQYRQESVIPLLGEALLDAHPGIWRKAMDGLVALGSPAAVAALRSARVHRDDAEFRRWLDEAIVQAEVEAQKS